MRSYEMIRELYTGCSRGRTRDVEIKEIKTDDLDSIVKQYAIGEDVSCEKQKLNESTVKYVLMVDGLEQRLTFTEL